MAEVVFSNNGRIVSMLADGSERKVLTGRAPRRQPSWLHDGDDFPRISPDGDRLLFIRTDEVTDDVYTYDLMVAERDGSGAASVAHAGDDEDERSADTFMAAASWSSDGERIYLTEMTYKGLWFTSRVDVMNADGSGRRTVARKRIDFGVLEKKLERKRPDLSNLWAYTQAEESPDSTKLLLSSSGYLFVPGLLAQLRVLDLDSGKIRVVENSASSGTWSHDGTRIAFTSERERRDKNCYESSCNFESKIFVMDADGSGARRLIRDEGRGHEFAPMWSADDSRILFTSDRNHPRGMDSNEIYSVRPDGTCLTWLTNGVPASGSGSWGPEAIDSGPGACGAAGREPLIEFGLPKRTEVAGGPVYWLGPDQDGLLPGYYSGAGRYVDYGDCAFFEASRCARLFHTVVTTEMVCRGDLHYSLEWGRFRGMTEMRGALVAKSAFAKGKPDALIVNTGSQSVGIMIYGSKRRGFKPYLKAFRSLVVAGDAKPAGPLPAARLSRRDVRKAARIAAKVRRGELDPGGRSSTYRAYLRFDRAVKRIGGVRTVACPGRRRGSRPGPSGPGVGPDTTARTVDAIARSASLDFDRDEFRLRP